MDNSLRSVEPLALTRPRNAHRFDAFSLKLQRRLTLYRRCALEAWLMLESDPAVHTFCERPGLVRLDGQRRVVDFWVNFVDREELVILPDPVVMDDARLQLAVFDTDAPPVRRIEPAELAAARVWIDNWQRMLPALIATRGLVPPSLLNAIERFVVTPQSLLAIEREFSTGDPVLARAAAFGLLHAGRVQAPELHTETLSLLTRFAAAEATS
ncbi:hypothetical protein [Paraburkholderia megapolitana]|uniref:Uncharacterized protein n=1 Tax=Paraburkholderia megapolitana TaxID=420953 RepID=A0A1I3W165_9BURK|nr:hypothetical protein [Paraburkholderia megapolitana]QDQ82182.1 hypothetical protein FNZ07_12830 [Paraburkholderia megapolitana]SFK00236.1 hypothetical protein SAMN05192543_11546 [Paraburkholderia megapolitana]